MLVQQENITFAAGAHLREDHPSFVLDLRDNVLVIELRDHYASVEAARRVVDPFVRSWELWAALEHGFGKFRFTYKAADVIDRSPPSPGPSPQFIQAAAIGSAAVMASGSLRVERSTYPSSPNDFVASADVETLWLRYKGYKDGKEPLLSMAYFCYTMIKTIAGGEAQAAEQYQVSSGILDDLRRLSSRRGDHSEARKYEPEGVAMPLTDSERRWIDASVRLLIKRVGEHEADPARTLPKLTKSDLPPIQ